MGSGQRRVGVRRRKRDEYKTFESSGGMGKRRRSTREILSSETDVLPNNESFDCVANGLK